ncbi:SusE domain-containing protein [Urechidicola croceus]|uniref:SusE outer membrane protein domain-containing protein n=1 Tax=Urechidicola croceus TaxID=1850246 RepID=A0A1D8P6E8_9FLAO|nr:SusE domain-containing protein [Urechidicola croceus]AOW20132.1 hypothetical protein LPB138_05300 [Urechidicola croceus]
MKKIFTILFSIITLLSLNSCDKENSPIFVAQEDQDGIEFLNSFAANYLLSEATEDNIADRFLWDSANFDVETNITYELQASIYPELTTFDVVGTTSENNLSVTVGQLLEFAEDLGLDDDPATTDANGLPNNVGQVYFRVRAYVGTTGDLETMSTIQPINITWIETVAVSDECPSIFAVGEALTDIGWNFSADGEVFCQNDILERKFRFTNGTNFRFFEESGNWASGLGYNYYIDEGFAIDTNLEAVNDGDDNFVFVGESGIYTVTINNVDKTIIVTPSSSLWAVGGAVPGGWDFNDDTVEFIESTPDVWSASITLSNDIFRFFQTFGTWDTNNNFAYYDDEGFTIDSNFESDGGGDSNFSFIGAPGTYILTINAVDKTITLD